MDVSPLLREIILHVVAIGMLDSSNAEQRRVIGVLLDQLRATPTLPLSIGLPTDRRARLVAERLQRHPADDAELDDSQSTRARARARCSACFVARPVCDSPNGANGSACCTRSRCSARAHR